MKKNNKLLISVPYIYPVCPLSIDHAKIMLVADINARLARAEGKDVFFPIAAHYSGVTAEKSIDNLKSDNKEVRVENVELIENKGIKKVYNFEVEDNHNYYVGKNKVLVHNACGHGHGESSPI